MSKPYINMAFGPDNMWILWLDASPGPNEPPHYRSSLTLPRMLERRLYGRRKDVKCIHAVSLGEDKDFILSFTPQGHEDQHLWHLDKYPNLDRWLLENPCDESTFWASLGPEAEFFACSKTKPHWNVDEDELEETLQELGKQKVAGVTFGVDGCTIVLDKDGKLTEIGDVEDRYRSLKAVLDSRNAMPAKVDGKANKARIVRSVALSPFAEDEYFIAFENGTYECRCAAIDTSTDPQTKTVFEQLTKEYRHRCDKNRPKPTLREENKTYTDIRIPRLLANGGKEKSARKVKEWPGD